MIRAEQQNRELPAVKGLLKLHILIACDEGPESLSFDEREQLSILYGSPPNIHHCRYLVTGQVARYLARHSFIQNDLQG